MNLQSQIDCKDVLADVLVEVMSFKLKLSDMKETMLKIGVHIGVALVIGLISCYSWSQNVGIAIQARGSWLKHFLDNLGNSLPSGFVWVRIPPPRH